MRAFLVLLLLLLSVLAPFALAGDDKGAGDEADVEKTDAEREKIEEIEKEEAEEKDLEEKEDDGPEREVKIVVSADKAEIKLERKAGGAEDEVKVVLDAGEASMKIEYKTENASAESETELKVKLREVVEYADDDADGAYDPGVDRVVARYTHEDLRWSVSAPVAVTDASGTGGQRIVGTGAFPEGGALSFVLSAYGDFANVNGTSLRPTDVKIDVLLEGFPYRENGTATALLFKTERKAEAELRNEGEGGGLSGVEAVANGFAAYFTWADVALVDGVEKPVLTTPVESSSESDGRESEQKDAFWLSYPRGAHVNHDPVLGVASVAVPQAQTPGPGVGLVAAAALGALLLARRRG